MRDWSLVIGPSGLQIERREGVSYVLPLQKKKKKKGGGGGGREGLSHAQGRWNIESFLVVFTRGCVCGGGGGGAGGGHVSFSHTERRGCKRFSTLYRGGGAQQVSRGGGNFGAMRISHL